MRPSRSRRLVSLIFLLAAAGIANPRAAIGETARECDLYLETVINGVSTGLIGAYRQRADGRLAIAPAELREVGLRPDAAAAAPDGLIDLDRLGVSYRYDAVNQAIRFEASAGQREPRVYDARGLPERGALPRQDVQSGYGAVMNYLLFGTTNAPAKNVFAMAGTSSAVSATLDGRIFSPYGVLFQSAIVTAGTGTASESVRLDTTWTYSDPASLITYRAGDVISGGLPWTRSVRLGGVQMQRNFALRPDLVTMPVPQLAGSAAVPSTLDVYVNNVRTFSQTLAAGPFEIRDLPVVSGPGMQRVVIRDATGRETVSDQPVYASSKLLRGGLFDFSVETGARRVNYGVRSNDYDSDPVASGSLRYGFADWLTLEGHGEGGAGLFNGGAGAVVPLGGVGIGSVAMAGSSADRETGMLYAASVELGFRNLTFYARTQRTAGNYQDIASLAAKPLLLDGLPLSSLRPPKALDQAALGIPLGFDPATLTLSVTRLHNADDSCYRILGATLSRPISRNASLNVAVFRDFGTRNSGVFASLSVSFGDGVSANGSVSSSPGSRTAGVDAVKAQSAEIGTYGWRVRDYEGTTPDRSAAVSYRAAFARMEAGVQQSGDTVRATAEAEGAIALAGGGVFFTNRIDDAFAVVDAGVPGVDVFRENRRVGATGEDGLLLIPDLRAYDKNMISIDAKNLPVDADVPRTKDVVAPPDRSGAVVKFGISASVQAAIVTLRDNAGAFLPAGSRGQLDGGESFVVGYDGQAYIRGLKQVNIVDVALVDRGTCRAAFPYSARPGAQVAIEGVVCR